MTDKEKIKELEGRLQWYEDSALESSYTACKKTIERFNEQLSNQEINIFDLEEKPIFEMAHKYLTEMDGYLGTLDKIRSRMNPEVAKAIDNKIKNGKLDEKDKALAL